MISDMVLFFKIGFLFRKEFEFDSRLLLDGEVDGSRKVLSDPVWSGPYNQVTSQSFSLLLVSFDKSRTTS